ncbi:MAG: hypothetical protein KAX86_05705, partial [Anaerolineales bacterium]|nr:hypothetical protein [Anaerolineales bacterium]
MGSSGSKYGIPAVIAAVVLCIACLCCIVAIVLYYNGDSLVSGLEPGGTDGPITGDPITPPDTSNLPEWTIIVYSDADDDVLEEDLWFDINEMEMVGSSPQVNIVAQVDRA